MEGPSEAIAYCHACGAAMNVSKVAPFSNVECPQCGKHTRVKREFGPYTLTRRLAIGGMSMVFIAQDNVLDREVALKILSETYSSDKRRIAAFEQEARLTASLGHPNIVRVYTTGKAFGRLYIAMELVPGGHFEHQITHRGAIPEEELLPLALDVAQGLKAAHSAGLIHRDVKPGNILLDADGRAKLVDFGLALVTQDGTAKAEELWATPYYVPPETIEGEPEDFRSDIYAFGATLYHALMGRPSCAEETMKTDVLRAAKKKIAPLATQEHPSSEEFRELIDRSMAYEPTKRYQSYDELIRDLGHALTRARATETIRGNHAALRRELKKQQSRSRMFALGGGVFLLASIIAAVLAVTTRKKPPPPPVSTAHSVTAPSVPDGSSKLAEEYRAARTALEKRDFENAATAFSALFANEAIQEPTRTWAGIEAVLANFSADRPAAARAAADAAAKHYHELPQDPGIGEEPITALESLSSHTPLPPPHGKDGVPALISAMLAGSKNWNQGLIAKALPCFEAAAATKLSSESQWAEIYRKIAADHLADGKLLTSPVFQNDPADAVACDAAIKQLEEISGRLKTRGRAAFNTASWKHELRMRRKILAEAPTPPPENLVRAEDDKLLEAIGKIQDFRFQEAAVLAKSSKPLNPLHTAFATLADSSAAFLDDLANDFSVRPAVLTIPLRTGESAVEISAGPGGKPRLGFSDGTAREATWSEIEPTAFVDLHRAALAATTAPTDRFLRHERAIFFDWLVGDRARAAEAAEKLSQSSPAFKARWDALISQLKELPQLGGK